MRAVVAFVLSFVFVVTMGMLMLPATAPRLNPKPLNTQARFVPNLEILPGPPSLVAPHFDDAAKRYEEAWRLLKARQYRAAEGVYLQILIHRPNDRKAMDGLVTLRRLQTDQDPQKLQEQAAEYRRAIVEGRVTDEKYNPSEMELLAAASQSAAGEIAAEQQLRVTVSARTSIGAGLAHPPASPHANALRDPLIAIGERIQRMAVGERPRPSSQSGNAIVIPTSVALQPSRSIALTREIASPRDANSPGASSGPPVTQSTPGGSRPLTSDLTPSDPPATNSLTGSAASNPGTPNASNLKDIGASKEGGGDGKAGTGSGIDGSSATGAGAGSNSASGAGNGGAGAGGGPSTGGGARGSDKSGGGSSAGDKGNNDKGDGHGDGSKGGSDKHK